MATTVNFASISGVISVTSGSNPPKYFYGAVGQFCQTPDATGYLIFIGETSFTVSLSELRINGQAPTSLENAATLLSALFQLTNSSSGGSGVGYPEGTKMYLALLTQSGTDAPVATVGVNTLGGTVVWTYESSGKYIATLSNAFTEGKTYILYSGVSTNGKNTASFLRISASIIWGYSLDDGSQSDDIWTDLPIQIIVLP